MVSAFSGHTNLSVKPRPLALAGPLVAIPFIQGVQKSPVDYGIKLQDILEN
jgi:hypothetical protein